MANSLLPHRGRPILKAVVLLLPVLTSLAAALSRESVLSQCTRALYRGDYLQAAQIAHGFLEKYPADVGIRVLLGRAELAQGQLQPALVDLRNALRRNPHNIDALYYLSFTARALSQQEYQRLFAMQPDSPRVHQLLAEAALEAQDPAQAEAEFEKALAGNPGSAEVATEVAELKRSQSKFDEAIDYYTRAQKTAPLTYTVAYGLGACYTYKQDYPRAIDWLRKAVALAPDLTSGHFALGNALFQSGQFEAAIPELNRALQLEPRMRQAYFLLGRAYTRLGRKDEADAAFQKLDELDRSTVPGETREQPDNASGKPETSR
jgi:tetratricopeptide (TPR) repeat protein